MANLALRIRDAASALFAKATTVASVVGRGMVDTSLVGWLGRYFSLSYERTKVHKDMHKMDKNCEITKFALNTIASRALGMEDPTLEAFTVTVQAQPDQNGNEIDSSMVSVAQWEISQLIERLHLQSESWQILRRAVKYGNEFRELVFDPVSRNYVGFQLLPEQTVWPNIDDKGRRVPGYKQIAESMNASDQSVDFAEHEIVHFAFGEIDGYLGSPLMDCARKNWKRLQLAEDSTAGARLMRAFMKLVHRVPVRGDWSRTDQKAAIDQYKEQMTKRAVFQQDLSSLESETFPTTVATDLYIPDDGSKRGGVEMLDPENSQLQNINDIKYFVDKLITATHVPKRYFPFEGSVPKLSEGGGSAEDKNFACVLVMCQNILKQGFSQLFDRQLIRKGIDPSRFRYVYRMADINTTDQLRLAQTQLALAKAFDLLAKQYPNIRTHVSVLVREYMRVSDASAAELMADGELAAELPAVGTSTARPDTDGSGADSRTTMPSAGMGEDERMQV